MVLKTKSLTSTQIYVERKPTASTKTSTASTKTSTAYTTTKQQHTHSHTSIHISGYPLQQTVF